MYSAEESHTHYSLQGLSSVNLVSGDHYVSTSENEVLVTILGSCISCCIRDPIAKVGGMNHFLLPSSTEKDVLICGKAARFGAYAMEVLINNLINKGAVKKRFEVKIFGGGHVTSNSVPIGKRNIEFVKSYISKECLSIASEDVGGNYPRRIHYYPISGKVMVRILTKNPQEIFSKEKNYYQNVSTKPVEGDVELF